MIFCHFLFLVLVGAIAEEESSLIPCPYLRGLVTDRNITAIFRPNESNEDMCNVMNFCQFRMPGFYCFQETSGSDDKSSTKREEGLLKRGSSPFARDTSSNDSSCWPAVMVQCPDGWLIRCRPGFACQERGGPWIDGTPGTGVSYGLTDWREAKCRALSDVQSPDMMIGQPLPDPIIYNTCDGPNPWIITSTTPCPTTLPPPFPTMMPMTTTSIAKYYSASSLVSCPLTLIPAMISATYSYTSLATGYPYPPSTTVGYPYLSLPSGLIGYPYPSTTNYYYSTVTAIPPEGQSVPSPPLPQSAIITSFYYY